ncbi:hypothetical protein PTKIN_Ptkin12aG0069100 [Pterospermum kingtungense]
MSSTSSSSFSQPTKPPNQMMISESEDQNLIPKILQQLAKERLPILSDNDLVIGQQGSKNEETFSSSDSDFLTDEKTYPRLLMMADELVVEDPNDNGYQQEFKEGQVVNGTTQNEDA